jgi:replicative DNA helicase
MAKGTLAPLSKVRASVARDRASGAYDKQSIKWRRGKFMAQRVGSMRPGDVLTVAARTNVGKSHFALRCMRDVASKCVYVSLEDSEDVVVDRTSGASQDDDARIILSRPRPFTLSAVVRHIKEASATLLEPDEPWLLVLDYIQLLQYDGEGSQWSATSAIASIIAELRALGEELGFAIMLIAQIVRPPKETKKRSKDDDDDEDEDDTPVRHPKPTLFDIRDSASIENASTFVVLLHPTKRGLMAFVAKHKSKRVCGKGYFVPKSNGALEEL